MSDKPRVGDVYELARPINRSANGKPDPITHVTLKRGPTLSDFRALVRLSPTVKEIKDQNFRVGESEIAQAEKAIELLTSLPASFVGLLDLEDFKGLKRRWIDPLFTEEDEASPASSEDASATQ